MADAEVDPSHNVGEDGAISTHVESQQPVMDQTQSHLASKLGRDCSHFTGMLVSLVIQVILVVKVSTIVSVGLSL